MEELESLVNVALMEPTMELEIRIGKIAFGRFCTDVSASAWNLVKRRLESYIKWSRTETQSFVDEHFEGRLRRRTFSDGRIEIVRKERIVVHDVPMSNRPMDLRISLSQEHRVCDSITGGASRKETKTRHRFVHKDIWAFELTEIEGSQRDIDSEHSKQYQIEIEFLPMGGSRKYPCKYLADYGKLLANDVLSMVG